MGWTQFTLAHRLPLLLLLYVYTFWSDEHKESGTFFFLLTSFSFVNTHSHIHSVNNKEENSLVFCHFWPFSHSIFHTIFWYFQYTTFTLSLIQWKYQFLDICSCGVEGKKTFLNKILSQRVREKRKCPCQWIKSPKANIFYSQ